MHQNDWEGLAGEDESITEREEDEEKHGSGWWGRSQSIHLSEGNGDV